MAWFVLMSVLSTLTTFEAAYVWTEWSNEAKCVRSCSKPSGTADYRRKCMKCDIKRCKPADDLYCDGHNEKVSSGSLLKKEIQTFLTYIQ